jgi:hypothetical protein
MRSSHVLPSRESPASFDLFCGEPRGKPMFLLVVSGTIAVDVRVADSWQR